MKFAVLNVCKSHSSQVKIFAELNLVISVICLTNRISKVFAVLTGDITREYIVLKLQVYFAVLDR